MDDGGHEGGLVPASSSRVVRVYVSCLRVDKGGGERKRGDVPLLFFSALPWQWGPKWGPEGANGGGQTGGGKGMGCAPKREGGINELLHALFASIVLYLQRTNRNKIILKKGKIGD